MKTPREILVIKPSSLGDVVHTLPAVVFVKRHWPESRLRWLVNPEWAPLLAGNPHIDETLIFPRGEFRGLRAPARIFAWAKMMRTRKADLVLDFQGLLRSGIISKLCRGGQVVGLSDAREGARLFYDRTADVTGMPHAVDRYLRLVRELEIDTSGPLEWPLPQGGKPADFSEAEPFVLLHPFSRGSGKSLSLEAVSDFCRTLAPHRVVIAGRADRRIAPQANVTDLLNRTSLTALIWLIRKAQFTVSVDSGPMHIAAAVTPRLLAIHTWSDPVKVGPYNPEAWVLKDEKLFQVRDLKNAPAATSCANFPELATFVRTLLPTAAAE